MNYLSFGRVLIGLVVLLFATSAKSVGPHKFDALQLFGSNTIPNQTVTATCMGSTTGPTLTCSSFSGTVAVGMVVVDTGPATIPNQTTVSAVAGGTVTLTNNPSVTFMADTIEFIGQQINNQLGASWGFTGTPSYPALDWELSAGTGNGPVITAGPIFKISKTESMAYGSAGCANAVDNACNAALVVASTGLGSDMMQNVALYAIGQSSQTGCSTCNAVAGRFQARVTGTNPLAKAAAANFVSENNATFSPSSNFASSGLKGFELDDGNNSGVDCPSVAYSGSGTCDGGEWIICNGSNTCGPAIHIGYGGMVPWDEGITINNSAINSTTGYSFNDQSSAWTSINIAGTHTAAINLGTNAGPVQLGNNNLDLFGGSAFINANAASLPAARPGTLVQIANADTTPTRAELDSFARPSSFTGIRADNTNAMPTAVVSGDLLATFDGWGQYSTSPGHTEAGAALHLYAEGTFSSAGAPGEACLSTAPSTSTTLTDSLCQHNTGGVTVGAATDEGANTLNAVALYQNGTALGTAATSNTGTSGASVPLLSGTNTWSGVQTFGAGDFVLSGAVNGDIGTFNASQALQDSGTLLSSLAPLASPTFTGTATLPDGTSCTSSGCTIGAILSLGSHQVNNTTSILSNSGSGYELNNGAASPSNPTFFPNRSNLRAGIGADAAGDISLFADTGSLTEMVRVDSHGIHVEGGYTYYFGTTQGVSCSGSPTASFASMGGIVTHC